jgi:hypothetical protein
MYIISDCNYQLHKSGQTIAQLQSYGVTCNTCFCQLSQTSNLFQKYLYLTATHVIYDAASTYSIDKLCRKCLSCGIFTHYFSILRILSSHEKNCRLGQCKLLPLHSVFCCLSRQQPYFFWRWTHWKIKSYINLFSKAAKNMLWKQARREVRQHWFIDR